MHGNKIKVDAILNIVWTLAICLATLSGSIWVTAVTTILFKNIKNNIVPKTLNIKCINAALFALILAPILDNKDVTQVPIFWPYNIGKAIESGINPCYSKTTSIPIDAL